MKARRERSEAAEYYFTHIDKVGEGEHLPDSRDTGTPHARAAPAHFRYPVPESTRTNGISAREANMVHRGAGPLTVLLAASVILATEAFGQAISQRSLTIELQHKGAGAGTVIVALWKGASTFVTGTPHRTASVQLTNGRAEATFADIDSGEYAVSAFVDRNLNGKLDRNFVGKPSEPLCARRRRLVMRAESLSNG
jgi:uncharacterized protein (DUF2141 family)